MTPDLAFALTLAPGCVSCWRSQDSTEHMKILEPLEGDSSSANTTESPPGTHANELLASDGSMKRIAAISVKCRSVPPSAGTTTTADRPPPASRRNAIRRPSGDQTGARSAPRCLVSWTGVPPSTDLT